MSDERKKKSQPKGSSRSRKPKDPLDIKNLPENAGGVDVPGGKEGFLPTTQKTQCSCVATVKCLGTIGCQAPTMVLNCSPTTFC